MESGKHCRVDGPRFEGVQPVWLAAWIHLCDNLARVGRLLGDQLSRVGRCLGDQLTGFCRYLGAQLARLQRLKARFESLQQWRRSR